MSLPKKPVFLSASRIETFTTCSALYHAKYVLKLPDPVGEAARRGSVAHDTLEILLNPRHEKIYQEAILHDSALEVPALHRVIERFARKYDVYTDKSLDMIDGYIMTALRNEFKGPKGTYKAVPEQAFEIEIDRKDGRKWCAKGFLDQVFFVEDESGKWLDIKDFKTGQLFKQEKLDYPVQALMYILAARHLYPEFTRRRFRFQFVKGKNKWETIILTDEELNGFEYILSDFQTAVDGFTEANAMDNTRAAKGESCFLYGQECKAKHPKDYFALLDENGQILAGAEREEDLKAKTGQTVEKRRYTGCPFYYNPETGQRRNFN